MAEHINNYPKLHNAMWPGVVGKGSGDGEPFIGLDTLLELTSKAEYEGQKFDGVDLWLADPHISIDSSPDDIKRVIEKFQGYGFEVGSYVVPIWGGAGGGSAMGDNEERKRFLDAVRKGSAIGKQMRDAGIRPSGLIRIDSSTSVEDWDKDPVAGTKRIAQTFREAGKIAIDYGEVCAIEGEICWGGMHSWRENVRVLEEVAMPGVVGYQADMAHSMLFVLGANSEKDRLLPKDYDWSDKAALDVAYKTVADALRPWLLDFHVAQNDGTTFGSGYHAVTGRHVPVDHPNGRLDITKHAGYWMRGDYGNVTKRTRHICWDGCIFPNSVMTQQKTWNDVLGAMVKVRDAHGWYE